MHKVYTSYYDNIKNGIGLRVSIARYPPKSKAKTSKINKWLYDLAPSETLLISYKSGKISWEEYVETYMKETKNPEFMSELIELIKILKYSDVTLYCYERPHENCHRHLLGEILKKLGYDVIEI